MVGIFSFLLLASIAVFFAAVILLIIRIVKKKPQKPTAIMTAGAVLMFIVSWVGIEMTYNPTPEQIAERERIAAEKTAEKAAQELTAAENTEDSSPAGTNSLPVSEQPANAPGSPVPDTSAEQPKPTVDSSAEPPFVDTPPASSDFGNNGADSDSENGDFIENYKTDIVVASKMILDNFIQNYEIPLATQLWTVAKFDENGAIAAMTDVTEKSTKVSVTAIVVLTPEMEEERMTSAIPHYVSVGDIVYGDDGYCEEVFAILEEALGSQ